MIIIDDNFTNDEYTKFIYVRNSSLSPEVCKEIIDRYEKSNMKHDGQTFSGVNKNIKDTKDLMMGLPEFNRINNLLRNELYITLKKHLSELSKKNDFKSE
jgi:hypothetical protein